MSCRWGKEFEINRDLIVSMKSAGAKYFADLQAKKQIEMKNVHEKENLEKKRKEKASKKSKLEEVKFRIRQTEIYLKIAGESIIKDDDGFKKLCLGKSLNRKAIQQAQALIDMGLEQKGNHC